MRNIAMVLMLLALSSAPLSFACGVYDTECSRQKRRVSPDGDWQVPIIKKLPAVYSKTNQMFRMVPTSSADGTLPEIMTYFPRHNTKVLLPFVCPIKNVAKDRSLNLVSIDRFQTRGKTYGYVIVSVPDQPKNMLCSYPEIRWTLLDEDGDGRFEVAQSINSGEFPQVPDWVKQMK